MSKSWSKKAGIYTKRRDENRDINSSLGFHRTGIVHSWHEYMQRQYNLIESMSGYALFCCGNNLGVSVPSQQQGSSCPSPTIWGCPLIPAESSFCTWDPESRNMVYKGGRWKGAFFRVFHNSDQRLNLTRTQTPWLGPESVMLLGIHKWGTRKLWPTAQMRLHHHLSLLCLCYP